MHLLLIRLYKEVVFVESWYGDSTAGNAIEENSGIFSLFTGKHRLTYKLVVR